MRAEVLIENAKKYVGTPYVWGGESLSEGGLDCSGLIYISLKDSGYKTVRKTAQGFSLIGKSVSVTDKNGDVSGTITGAYKDSSNNIMVNVKNSAGTVNAYSYDKIKSVG